MGCLDDNVAVDFAQGSLSGVQAAVVERHLASCRDCRTLVATLAPGPGERDSDLATAPRRGRGSDAGHGRTTEPVVALGDQIGRYVVLRRLGAGGMGVVFAAYDPQLDRKIALKLLRTGIGLGEREANARLVREAQAIARLSHPNVVAVYDVGTAGADADLYLAMEFVEGDTLTHWLRRWERPWPEIVAMFVEAGRGLAAAHAVGLLHRDFKPDNVLVGSDGRVRVSDFGLARSAVTDDEGGGHHPVPALSDLRTPLTGTGAILGTPRYMAPEQLRGASVTATADQFSFCVALYEALYGQHPLPGETAAEMADGTARMAAPPASSVVAPALATILARGLDPQPARRFPSMTALLEQLIPPAPRPRPRRLALVAFGAASLVLAGAGAAMVLRPDSQTSADQIHELEAQVRKEQDRNQAMREVLADYQKRLTLAGTETSARAELEDRVRSLQTILDDRVRKIADLEDKIAQVERGPAAPITPPRPRPPDERGLRQEELQVVMDAQREQITGCFVEWSTRTGRTNAILKVTFKVWPEGRVPVTGVTGLEDRIVPECVAQNLRRLRYPPRAMTTVVGADIGFSDGKITVTPYRLGIEDPPPRIDSPGE